MTTRIELASMLDYPQLRFLTLQTMRELETPATNADINETVAAKLGLTEEQMNIPCSNGSMPEYALRVSWCRTQLKNIGLALNVKTANWEPTEIGRRVSRDDVEQLYRDWLRQSRRKRTPSADLDDDDEDFDVDGDFDADEVPSSWQDELLGVLHQMSWQGFEQLARRLLLAAGFDEVEVTSSGRDGGIDGFGTYRPSGLISFRTSFQCKRWEAPVRSPQVQAFQGAILGQSDRGIIITTSYFTKDAIEQASRPGGLRIDLIDGTRLVELLREHQIGVHVQKRTVEVVRVAKEYFERLERTTQ